MEFKDITEKIIEYLDGELPVTHEQELFQALAANEELRRLMREHLTISRTIQYDVNSLQPPASATVSIINTLGLSVANNFTNSSLHQKTSPPILKKANKFLVPAFLAILSSLLTFVATYYYFSTSKNEIQESKAIVQTPPIIVSTAEPIKPIVHKVFVNKSSHEVLEKEEVATHTNFPASVHTPVLQFSQTKINLGGGVNALGKSNNFVQPENNILVNQRISNEEFKNKNIRNVSLSFRGIVGKSFPNPSISSSSTNKTLTNASAGLYFTQWDNIRFGIEFGNEVFGLSYKNVMSGIEYSYEQKPSIYWAAVGLDYTFPFNVLNIENLYPYTTLLAGGSQIGGPLLKGIAGLKYRPLNSNFEIYFGTEGTLLLYQNQKNYYLTRKISFTYGMSITF